MNPARRSLSTKYFFSLTTPDREHFCQDPTRHRVDYTSRRPLRKRQYLENIVSAFACVDCGAVTGAALKQVGRALLATFVSAILRFHVGASAKVYGSVGVPEHRSSSAELFFLFTTLEPVHTCQEPMG